MNTVKWFGLLFLAGGLCVLGYQGLESIMAEGDIFNTYKLVGVFGEEAFEWINQVPGAPVRDGIYYVIEMPLYALLLIIGAVLLVISGIFGRR